jgi:hypothetical protein
MAVTIILTPMVPSTTTVALGTPSTLPPRPNPIKLGANDQYVYLR